MAEAIVSSVVQTLTDLLREEANFLAGVDGQVQGITDALKMLQSFLKDADARKIDDNTVRTWVERATKVAYHAEDVLETYVLEVQSKRRGGIINILKRYACLLNECILLHKIGKEAQGITTRISRLTEDLDNYDIRRTIMEAESSSSAHERQRQLRRRFSRVVEEDFVGLEGDVKNMVDHLLNEERDKYYQVVSIFGMGGLGKTTLAQKIYNHPNVKRHFDMVVWVSISQKWETNDVLQRILIKFIPEKREDIMKWIDDELFRQLFQILKNKRCLIVLDDVWSTDVWTCLAPGFPAGKTGSKVLLTTRNEEVTLQIDRQVFRHQPRILSEDESWELLQKKALRNRESTDPSYTKKMELGKEMVKQCGGLPLAVVVLGGLLATKEALSEWDIVHKNVKSYLSRGKSTEHGGRVVDILALSYDDLPYQLKPCFLYLGNFEEDSEIEVERLYQLWMAEGMVSLDDKSEEETMMDVAERYLGELAQRCIVQVQVEEESSIRRFSSCRLHDLMRDLCLSKGKEDNFLKVIDYRHGYDHHESVESSASINNTRRLSIYLGEEGVRRYVFPEKKTVRHLRSLLVFISGNELVGLMSRMMISQFKDFKMLRVLAIEELVPFGEIVILCQLIDNLKLTKGIGNLIHLRYLSLRGFMFLKFPSSFGNLKHLQTLDLRGVQFVLLWKVKVLRKMGRLIHLYLPESNGGILFIVGKLRLDGLNQLEILENFNPAWCEVKDLSTLNNLRELKVVVVEELEDLPAIILHVGNITQNHLRYLSLNIECRFCSEDDLTLLTQLLGCPVLQKLEIDGLICKLPENTHFSSSLTQLSLYESGLEEDPMATLEKLPNLHRLSLKYNAFNGEEIVCSAMGFPQLKKLVLRGLNNLQKWRVDKGAMPNLSTLKIYSCNRLQRVPEGLKFVTTLQELVILSMPHEFKERIRIVDGQEGEDFDRVAHIPSIVFD